MDVTAPGAERPLFRRIAVAAWRTELCSELAVVLDAILREDHVRITALGYANVKAPELVAALDRAPSERALAAARAAAGDNPDLVFTAEGIGCRRHFAEIDWTSPATPPRTLWRRLLRRG